MRTDKKNIIVELTVEFALGVIEFCEELNGVKKYDLSRQLFKAGTSIGANVHEAQNAESKADLIHKMKIAAKEADETSYWLTLCSRSKYCPSPNGLEAELENIAKVLSKIISTSKNKD